MFRILLAADGSEPSARAVAFVIKYHAVFGETEIHVVNVQPGLPGTAGGHLTREQRRQFHDDEGQKALAPARKALDAAGIKYIAQVSVGEPGPAIGAYCRDHKIDQVVMGTRGRGALQGAILGSVSHDVIAECSVPVLLVK